MARLKNKIALVTGAASGIGEAIAQLFLKEGAKVILTDKEKIPNLPTVPVPDNNACFYPLDVSQESQWKSVSSLIAENWGHIDILVNNAGITGLSEKPGFHDPENFTLDGWQHVHDINLTGTALGCKYGIALMKDSKAASIVNISSRSGIVGIPHASAYASSKAAVRNHTKSVALYCAEKNYPIRCNSIHPGAVLTPLWDPMLGAGKQRTQAIEKISCEIPLGKMGAPIDVAYATLYLASDESVYVTGIELNVDGGILAGAGARYDKEEQG